MKRAARSKLCIYIWYLQECCYLSLAILLLKMPGQRANDPSTLFLSFICWGCSLCAKYCEFVIGWETRSAVSALTSLFKSLHPGHWPRSNMKCVHSINYPFYKPRKSINPTGSTDFKRMIVTKLVFVDYTSRKGGLEIR